MSARSNTWVAFEDDEAALWVGVFVRGEITEFDAVVPFAHDGGRTVLVVAGGTGYLVDTKDARLLRLTTPAAVCAAIAPPSQDFVLVAEASTIWAVRRMGDTQAWQHLTTWWGAGRKDQQLATDGITMDHAASDHVTGTSGTMTGGTPIVCSCPSCSSFRASGWQQTARTGRRRVGGSK